VHRTNTRSFLVKRAYSATKMLVINVTVVSRRARRQISPKFRAGFNTQDVEFHNVLTRISI
jgi:hypothetical protein